MPRGPRDRRVRLAALGAVLVIVVLAASGTGRAWSSAAHRAFSDATLDADAAAVRRLAERLAPLHAAKTPPQPGEWLDAYREQGQTFAQYAAARPRGLGGRTTLYIQPLGDFTPAQAALVDGAVDYLGRFFALPVARLEGVALDVVPGTARRGQPRPEDLQILSTWVLDWLERRRPDDAVAVLALTAVDLWPGDDWNFVFGQASLDERVGVWSIARFGDPAADPTLTLRRTIGTAAHETGHMLGIRHCIAYECAMNGSNHQEESDRQPLAFCPECVAKLWWTCVADPVERCARLEAFARGHALADEADHWARAATLLRQP
ncbi:MAG TPA: archaemetzincin [Planctomycetota bacterium]|nr:archaemetzincin [Planctomycetota bacterium]